MHCHFYGSALATKLRLLGNKKFIRKLPKICNIQFRIFAKKTPVIQFILQLKLRRILIHISLFHTHIDIWGKSSINQCRIGGDRLLVVPMVSVCTLHMVPSPIYGWSGTGNKQCGQQWPRWTQDDILTQFWHSQHLDIYKVSYIIHQFNQKLILLIWTFIIHTYIQNP